MSKQHLKFLNKCIIVFFLFLTLSYIFSKQPKNPKETIMLRNLFYDKTSNNNSSMSEIKSISTSLRRRISATEKERYTIDKDNENPDKSVLASVSKMQMQMHHLNKEIAMKFNNIAQSHFWEGGNETVSGKGSTIISTTSVRKCLGRWIIKYNITSIADIPCGDCNWQHAIPGIKHVNYRGYDVSQYAIERASKKNPGWKFELLDLTMSVPPKADLVILRDVLQHLPLENGKQALNNVFKSNSTWLGITTYNRSSANRNIKFGEYYLNNVLKVPFELPEPVQTCDNYYGEEYASRPDSKFYLIKL